MYLISLNFKNSLYFGTQAYKYTFICYNTLIYFAQIVRILLLLPEKASKDYLASGIQSFSIVFVREICYTDGGHYTMSDIV